MGIGASHQYTRDKRVVVVGGNIAGINAAQELEKLGFSVTILEPRNFGWIPFSAFRASVASDGDAWAKRMTVPLDRILKRGKFVRGLATGVDKVAKTLSYTPHEGGEPRSLNYDYLVIATGARFAAPFNPIGVDAKGARAALGDLRRSVNGAKRIIIVGGGPSGIELAGELRDASDLSEITILHSGSTLLSGAGNKAPPAA